MYFNSYCNSLEIKTMKSVNKFPVKSKIVLPIKDCWIDPEKLKKCTPIITFRT